MVPAWKWTTKQRLSWQNGCFSNWWTVEQCFFWWFEPYTLLACLREGLRKPTRLRGVPTSTSQLPGAYANAYAGKC